MALMSEMRDGTVRTHYFSLANEGGIGSLTVSAQKSASKAWKQWSGVQRSSIISMMVAMG